jgi:hypothetical protein
LRAARDPKAQVAQIDDPKALAGGQTTTNGLVTLFAPEKAGAAGEDRISIALTTDPSTLVVRLRGSRQAAIDAVLTFF